MYFMLSVFPLHPPSCGPIVLVLRLEQENKRVLLVSKNSVSGSDQLLCGQVRPLQARGPGPALRHCRYQNYTFMSLPNCLCREFAIIKNPVAKEPLK